MKLNLLKRLIELAENGLNHARTGREFVHWKREHVKLIEKSIALKRRQPQQRGPTLAERKGLV